MRGIREKFFSLSRPIVSLSLTERGQGEGFEAVTLSPPGERDMGEGDCTHHVHNYIDVSFVNLGFLSYRPRKGGALDRLYGNGACCVTSPSPVSSPRKGRGKKLEDGVLFMLKFYYEKTFFRADL